MTSEQIEWSRKELADLERKFLERVAQTNRAKTGTTGGVTKCKKKSISVMGIFVYYFVCMCVITEKCVILLRVVFLHSICK